MLHIINKSHSDRSIETVLRLAKQGSAVLLIEDAVYAATTGNVVAAKIQAAMADLKIYALKPDLDTRGMAGRVMEGITLVDYAGFVDLVAAQPNCQSWL
jgi:tRNA 2-thiouridine synthesizing protein B